MLLTWQVRRLTNRLHFRRANRHDLVNRWLSIGSAKSMWFQSIKQKALRSIKKHDSNYVMPSGEWDENLRWNVPRWVRNSRRHAATQSMVHLHPHRPVSINTRERSVCRRWQRHVSPQNARSTWSDCSPFGDLFAIRQHCLCAHKRNDMQFSWCSNRIESR